MIIISFSLEVKRPTFSFEKEKVGKEKADFPSRERGKPGVPHGELLVADVLEVDRDLHVLACPGPLLYYADAEYGVRDLHADPPGLAVRGGTRAGRGHVLGRIIDLLGRGKSMLARGG